MDRTSDRIARDLAEEITDELTRIGLLMRVFSRAKDERSAMKKIDVKNYDSTRKLQDSIGVRVNLYFMDDINIAKTAIKNRFEGRFQNEAVDQKTADLFCPQRINLVFRLTSDQAKQVTLVRNHPDKVDETFEIQIRTVLSEGWHEVEHDLRYKRQGDWIGHVDLSRALNGIVATLETCDWSMLQLFDDLSLRHYRAHSWESMMRARFRIRISGEPMDDRLVGIFNEDEAFRRAFFRVPRTRILGSMVSSQIAMPLTVNNLTYLANHISVRNERIDGLTPALLRQQFERLSSQS
jgi:putative GTP pyrophosphokinase